MWKFWAILAAALLAGGIYVVAQTRSTPVAPPPAPTDVAPRPEPAPPPPKETFAPEQPPAPKPEPPPAPVTKVETPLPAAATPEPAPPTPTPAPDTKDFEDLVPSNPTPDLTPPPPEKPKPEPAAEPAPTKKLGDFAIIPGKVEKKDDGSLLLDGKYPLKGEGTPDKPYVVTWDLLTSAEEAFDPQNGKKRLPERIAMLDGKTVRLSGYIAFPMTSKEPRELLSMLNQWDGCCIGTPPTPYDAVEVTLDKAVTGDDRFATTGKVVGTFHVKPYLEGDWLIGLYVMEPAKLTPRDFGPGAN